MTGCGVMTILVYKGLIRNPENIEFYPIPGDWNELLIPNLAGMSLMKCYWMLQNARVTAFTVSEVFMENQQGGIKLRSLHPSQYPDQG